VRGGARDGRFPGPGRTVDGAEHRPGTIEG
jgi:hypothetical protein